MYMMSHYLIFFKNVLILILCTLLNVLILNYEYENSYDPKDHI
jgi:hypothetical protein